MPRPVGMWPGHPKPKREEVIEMDNSTAWLVVAVAMMIAYLWGGVTGVMIMRGRPLPGPPVPRALADLPDDHPLHALVGTVIVRGDLR